MEAMNSADVAFLHFESKDTPMHIGCVFLLEKPKTNKISFFQAFKDTIIPRLESEPLFRRKLAHIPYNLFYPVWIQTDIDCNKHIHHVHLPSPGTQKQLEDCIAELHSTLLDRHFPLWEINVIEGLETEEICVYFKIHHALLDGSSALQLSEAMLDHNPAIQISSKDKISPQSEYPNKLSLLWFALKHTISQYKKNFLQLPKNFLHFLSDLRKNNNDSLFQLFATSSNKKLVVPKTAFNKAITYERTFATVSLPLDSIQSLAKEYNVFINDVLLTICSGAVRHYLSNLGELPKETLITGVPISLSKSTMMHYSNRTTMGLMSLASDIGNPFIRLQMIHDAMNSMKKNFIKNKYKLDSAIDVPLWLLCLLTILIEKTKFIDLLPSKANLIISNLPGPQEPVYLAGCKILSCFPITIVINEFGLNITMITYFNSINIGITAAKNSISDASIVAAEITASFEELCKGLEQSS